MESTEVRRIRRDGKTLLEIPEDYFWALVGNAQHWTIRMMLSRPMNELDQLSAADPNLEQFSEQDPISVTSEAARWAMDVEKQIMDLALSEAFEEFSFPYRKPD